MFKLYYASAIDNCQEKTLKQIEEFKKIFKKYSCSSYSWSNGIPNHPIRVYGAGFGSSPIITPENSKEYKGAVSAYDLRKIRECDCLLVVIDNEQFCFGTAMEMEYAKQLGLYIIVLSLGKEKVKSIFIETFANKIIYSMKELEEILKDFTQ